jgi:hypothetical protein
MVETSGRRERVLSVDSDLVPKEAEGRRRQAMETLKVNISVLSHHNLLLGNSMSVV